MATIERKSVEPIFLWNDEGERRLLCLAHQVIYSERTADGGVAVDMYGAREGSTAAETIGRVELGGREAETFAVAAGDRMGRLWYPC